MHTHVTGMRAVLRAARSLLMHFLQLASALAVECTTGVNTVVTSQISSYTENRRNRLYSLIPSLILTCISSFDGQASPDLNIAWTTSWDHFHLSQCLLWLAQTLVLPLLSFSSVQTFFKKINMYAHNLENGRTKRESCWNELLRLAVRFLKNDDWKSLK